MKNLRYYLRPCYRVMALGLAVKSVGTFLELLLPRLLTDIIDIHVPAKDTNEIIQSMAMMFIFATLACIMNIYANRNAAGVARDVTRNIRHDLFDKTLYLANDKTDAFTIPSLESRLTSDTYHVHRMIGMLQRMGIRAPIITIGGIVMTFIIDPRLAVAFLAIMPFMAFLVYVRVAKGVPLFAFVQKASDKMVTVVRENTQGIRVIKALSRTAYERDRFNHANEDLRGQEIHANRIMSLINPMMNLLLYAGMIIVIVFGAYLVDKGLSKAGKIIAFMSYFQMISRSFMAVGRMFIMYSRGMASSDRIMEILNTKTEKDFVVGKHAKGDPSYALEFNHVTFSYLKVKDNLKDISFRMRKGESLGIIGATGSGKTTILSLLMRFYDVDKGNIFVDGIDVRDLDITQLRQMFSIVAQNDFLYGGSIRENIMFGRELGEDRLQQALLDAQASDFIETMEDGLEHMLAIRGSNLSGGQRQRVLLARALAKKPSILILDDSSSALDYATDARLRKALRQNYSDVTRIIVAQRVSSIQACDQIMVLDHGEISGIGTHGELMESNSLYREISDSQMGGALLE